MKFRNKIKEFYKIEKINLKVKEKIKSFFNKWHIIIKNNSNSNNNTIKKYCKIKRKNIEKKNEILITINVKIPILYLENEYNTKSKNFNFLKL